MKRMLGALLLLTLTGAGDAAIGLSARFDRPSPLYSPDEPVMIIVGVEKAARIEIWRARADGIERRVVPATRSDSAVEVQPGRPATLIIGGPPSGRLSVGQATVHIVASALQADTRSLANADSRLAGRNQREDRRMQFEIVP